MLVLSDTDEDDYGNLVDHTGTFSKEPDRRAQTLVVPMLTLRCPQRLSQLGPHIDKARRVVGVVDTV